MNNVFIGAFSIPGGVLIAAGVVVPLYTSNHALGGLAMIGYGAMIAGVLALAANGYAIRTASRYKKTSVATLAVVLPWISAVISAIGIIWGAHFVATI